MKVFELLHPDIEDGIFICEAGTKHGVDRNLPTSQCCKREANSSSAECNEPLQAAVIDPCDEVTAHGVCWKPNLPRYPRPIWSLLTGGTWRSLCWWCNSRHSSVTIHSWQAATKHTEICHIAIRVSCKDCHSISGLARLFRVWFLVYQRSAERPDY